MRNFFLACALVFATPAFAQQPPPEIRFHSAPDFLQLPPDLYLGEVTGVAVNASVTIVFDEPVDPVSVSSTTFYVQDSVGRIGGVGNIGQDGKTLTFVPNQALSVNRSHTVFLTDRKSVV